MNDEIKKRVSLTIFTLYPATYFQEKFYLMQSTAGKFVLSMICFGANPPRFGYEVNLFIGFLFLP